MPISLKNNLVIAVKTYSDKNYPFSAEQVMLYLKYLKTFDPKDLIVITKRGNPFARDLAGADCKVIEIDSEKFGYAEPTMQAFKEGKDSYLLTISVGVELEKWQLAHGFELLKSHNLLGVGWKITSQNNDGSYIGKLSYNTCMLYAPGYYDLALEAGGIPPYVENASLGEIKVKFENNEKTIPLGGQEELVLQMRIFKFLVHKKHKLFGHIKHYGLQMSAETGEGTDFDSKIMRKVMTAEAYKVKEGIDPNAFMDSWVIV